MASPGTRKPAVTRAAEFHIDRAGVWRHRGSVVQREAMVRLFASMLERREDRYVLVTPEQTLRVNVDDAPFVVVDMEGNEDGEVTTIVLVTNVGERFVLGPEHPLYLHEDVERSEVRAYQMVRDRMPALVHRNVFYRLVELAQANEDGVLGVCSSGCFFPLELSAS